MRSLWITLTLGLTVFLSGETVSFLLGTQSGLKAAGGQMRVGLHVRSSFQSCLKRILLTCNNKRLEQKEAFLRSWPGGQTGS